MNYIDEFISEQANYKVLAGYDHSINLEYIDNTTPKYFIYKTFDDPNLDDALLNIVDLIKTKKYDSAMYMFEDLCTKIAEGRNIIRKNRVWNSLLNLANDLKDQDIE